MDKKVLISAQCPSMPWVTEAKDLVKKGFILSIERCGIENQVVKLKALHTKYGSVTIETWDSFNCPLRFNWMERVA